MLNPADVSVYGTAVCCLLGRSPMPAPHPIRMTHCHDTPVRQQDAPGTRLDSGPPARFPRPHWRLNLEEQKVMLPKDDPKPDEWPKPPVQPGGGTGGGVNVPRNPDEPGGM